MTPTPAISQEALTPPDHPTPEMVPLVTTVAFAHPT